MKTPQNSVNEDTYKRIRDRVLSLVPPQPHRLSLTNGKEFARTVGFMVAKYATSLPLSEHLLRSDFIQTNLPVPVYGDFLIGTMTLNATEPVGTYLFALKQTTVYPDLGATAPVSAVLTPASFIKISGNVPEAFPKLYRAAFTWYGDDSGWPELIPNLNHLITDGRFHTQLIPVGPLVENNQSSFVSRVVSVVRGDVVTKTTPMTHVKLILPLEGYLDLDEHSSSYPGQEPQQVRCTLYACIVYGLVNHNPTMSLYFVKSGKGVSEVKSLLVQVFEDTVINKLLTLQPQIDIKRVTSGALIPVGHCSPLTIAAQKNLHWKNSSLPVVEISDFVAEPGSWQVFL